MSIRRQDIIDAIKSRLQTISTTNGYHTNLGANVFVYRDAPIEPYELPALVVKDYKCTKVDELTDVNLSFENWNVFIEVEFVFATSGNSITDVRKGIADVYKAIG